MQLWTRLLRPRRAGVTQGVAAAWAKRCKRVLRASTYFLGEGRSVELGCLLLVVSEVARLHHRTIGHGGQSRATLEGLVDLFRSIVAESLQRLVRLLERWQFDASSPWHLLVCLGLNPLDCKANQLLCRRSLVRVSCDLCRRLDIRFTSRPFPTQWLWSKDATGGDT